MSDGTVKAPGLFPPEGMAPNTFHCIAHPKRVQRFRWLWSGTDWGFGRNIFGESVVYCTPEGMWAAGYRYVSLWHTNTTEEPAPSNSVPIPSAVGPRRRRCRPANYAAWGSRHTLWNGVYGEKEVCTWASGFWSVPGVAQLLAPEEMWERGYRYVGPLEPDTKPQTAPDTKPQIAPITEDGKLAQRILSLEKRLVAIEKIMIPVALREVIRDLKASNPESQDHDAEAASYDFYSALFRS